MPSSGALIPPSIIALRPPEIGKPLNLIDTETYLELYTESQGCRVYFTTDGTKPNPFSPKVGGKEATFRYKAPFTLKPGKRTLRCLAITRDGRSESSVVTKTFNVEELEPEYTSSDGESDFMTFVSSESDVDFEKERKAKEKKKKEKEEKKKEKEREKEREREKEEKEKEREKLEEDREKLEEEREKLEMEREKLQRNIRREKEKVKETEKGKGKEKEKEKEKGKDKEKEKEKETEKEEKPENEKEKADKEKEKKKKKGDEKKDKEKKDKDKEKKKKDENKDSKDSKALVPSHMPKEAWGTPGAAGAGSHDVDGPFNPTNYSGTQINLWGVPPDQWPALNVGPHGTVFQPAPPKPEAPRITEVPSGISTQQLGNLTNQVMQKLDDTAQMTVKDVRKAIEAAKQEIPVVVPQSKPEAKEPTLMPVSAGNGDVKKQISHIYAHLLEYAKKDPNFRAAVSQPKFGKILSADMDESADSYLITIQLGKPGVKKSETVAPPPKKVEKARRPSKEQAAPPPKKEKPKPEENKRKVAEEVPFFETEEYEQEGTLKPAENFDAEADCEKLRKAMKGLGTDEQAIIDVLGYRSVTQRLEVVKQFKLMYGKDLMKELKSELSSHFLDGCLALCREPDEYDAAELRRAMKGLGTDEDALIEIVCTRTSKQMEMIKSTYKRVFNRDLEADIESETSGHYKRLLISLLQAARDENPEFDRNKAKKDAEDLYQAGEKKWGTDESRFNVILCSRSYPHLRAVFEEYEKIAHKDIEESIKSEMSGDLKNGMLTVVRCIKYKPTYFAMALQKAMKGLGTDDNTLVRIIVSRCETDMVQIKAEFAKLYKGTLYDWIVDDTSGDYRRLMCVLIGEPYKKK